MAFSDALRKVLFGTPFGQGAQAEAPITLSTDGRTAALRVLRLYLSELVFFRSGGAGRPPKAFRIPATDIFIERADDEAMARSPSLAVLPGRATYEAIGLGAYCDEESRDVYGKGTVLWWMSEYTETVTLVAQGSSRAERRALAAGIEQAMSPTETMYGLRFTMPEYYGQLVCFSLGWRENDDGDEAGLNRWKVRFEVEMRFTNVTLQPYVQLEPEVVALVDHDEGIGEDVVLDESDPNTSVLPAGS